MTLAQLADHFQQRELGHSNSRISYSTKRAYQGYLGKWIVPRWGDYQAYFADIAACGEDPFTLAD